MGRRGHERRASVDADLNSGNESGGREPGSHFAKEPKEWQDESRIRLDVVAHGPVSDELSPERTDVAERLAGTKEPLPAGNQIVVVYDKKRD